VHSIPCLAGGLILSEHIKVAEVDGLDNGVEDEKATAIDKVFNGERKTSAKRSSTK
jgi:hypothetical protein